MMKMKKMTIIIQALAILIHIEVADDSSLDFALEEDIDDVFESKADDDDFETVEVSDDDEEDEDDYSDEDDYNDDEEDL